MLQKVKFPKKMDTMETILRSFEMVSVLEAIFFKSKLYGLNLEGSFLEAASNFLCCNIDCIPFWFLGVVVGANPRRYSTWSTTIDSMWKRLSEWNGRHLSIGGRLVLLNSVLSSIPLYYLSFYKAPRKVIEELTQIQRSFLRGGGLEGRRINGVSWDKVCLPKEDNVIWSKLIKFRYGSISGKLLNTEGETGSRMDSIWKRGKHIILEGNMAR